MKRRIINMGYWKDRSKTNYCNAYNKDVGEANSKIGEMMEKNKSNKQELLKIKNNPSFGKTSLSVKRMMDKYIRTA
jgi:hypothetical protein